MDQLDYKVVCEPTVVALTASVHRAIADGWKPCGGVASQGQCVMQAMTKKVKPQNYLPTKPVSPRNWDQFDEEPEPF